MAVIELFDLEFRSSIQRANSLQKGLSTVSVVKFAL